MSFKPWKKTGQRPEKFKPVPVSMTYVTMAMEGGGKSNRFTDSLVPFEGLLNVYNMIPRIRYGFCQNIVI
jgi:hypothetical protein